MWVNLFALFVWIDDDDGDDHDDNDDDDDANDAKADHSLHSLLRWCEWIFVLFIWNCADDDDDDNDNDENDDDDDANDAKADHSLHSLVRGCEWIFVLFIWNCADDDDSYADDDDNDAKNDRKKLITAYILISAGVSESFCFQTWSFSSLKTQVRKITMDENPGVKFGEISRIVAERWRGMSDADKQVVQQWHWQTWRRLQYRHTQRQT